MQDPNYKRIFSFPRMVEDLLRGFLPGRWLDELDFSTLKKLPAEYVSDELLKRHGDCVWRMRRRGEWLYLLVLLEFQSTDEPRMALRILTYTSLLYQELVRNDALDASGRLLPVVLYNGDSRWRALEVGGVDRAGGTVARAVPAVAALHRGVGANLLTFPWLRPMLRRNIAVLQHVRPKQPTWRRVS